MPVAPSLISPMTTNRRRFVDLDLDFTDHPITKDISVKLDEEAIKRAVRNLVQTKKYERFFHPEIDSGIADMLFEPTSPVIRLRIQQLVKEVVVNFEPRVEVSSVTVIESNDGHGLEVTLEYFIKNVREPKRFSFSLQRS